MDVGEPEPRRDGTLISVVDVSYSYRPRGREVVENVSLDVDARATVIIGPNGAGKSTLVKLMAGHLRCRRGRVVRPRLVGYSPQRSFALPAFTVREQVEYLGWLAGLSRRSVVAKATRALELVDLVDLSDRKTSSLSGGELSRLGIAGGVVADPPVVLLDEPTAALDPLARTLVTRTFSNLIESGIGIVITSHTASDVGEPFSRVILMNHGHIALDATPARFLAGNHSDPVANEFAEAIRGHR